MILEWQQYAGCLLLAGGASNHLDADRWLQVLPTQTEACVTTISTVWNEILQIPLNMLGLGQM